eukprot:m.205544 g.205544  ORF g.205544 m.205544 type:complete len:77 (+) comp32921_c0_seq2:2391-2621(+)
MVEEGQKRGDAILERHSPIELTPLGMAILVVLVLLAKKASEHRSTSHIGCVNDVDVNTLSRIRKVEISMNWLYQQK